MKHQQMKSFLKATPFERQATFSIAAIMAIRMLGLFMILPIFATAATHLSGANHWTIGLALGVYGLTQACLQIPFGMLSDRLGRKPVITLGLCIFAAGSLLAAGAHTMTTMIIARAIQGGGAIGSSCIALLADCTREEQRTKSMAVLGLTIGFAFSLAMVLGPLCYEWLGLSGIFMMIFVLALLALLVLWGLTPSPTRSRFHADAEPELSRLWPILCHPELWRLDVGILCLHACLTGLFTALPGLLSHELHINSHQQWMVYLPIMFMSFLTMLPMVIVAESKRRMKGMFITAIILLLLAVPCFMIHSLQPKLYPLWIMLLGLWIFFTGFNALEAMLPSLVSKIAPLGRKGTAVGIFSTSQFLGIFLGGVGAGFAQHHMAPFGLWWFMGAILAVWLILAITMRKPPTWSHQMINLQGDEQMVRERILAALKDTPGVLRLSFNPADGIAYLKIESTMVAPSTIHQIVTAQRSL